MPTIRGYTKGVEAEFKNFINNYMARQVTIVKKAGLKAMEILRKRAVNDWYNSTAKHAMNASTQYEVKNVKQSGDKIEVVFRSYVDEGMFESLKAEASSRNLVSSPYSSVVMWRQRHEKDGWKYKGIKQPQMDDDIYSKTFPAISMPYSIGEYMLNLPWEEGIVGLPPHERHTGTKWENSKKYKSREPLKTFVEGRFEKGWAKAFTEAYSEIKGN